MNMLKEDQPKSGLDRMLCMALSPAFLALIGLSLSSSAARASLDYLAAAGGRVVPLGASLVGELGWNQLLWGSTQNGPLHYGYLRPAFRVSASGFVNSA